jgi:hypothetical protein
MRYFWAGSACYDFVAFVLEEADFSRFGGIAEKCTSALWLFNYILSHGYGYETHDRDDPQLQQPGNLIMMDITHNGDFSDHIGIFTEKGDEFAHDRTMGNFGFYSSPFYYRAHDANMQDFNDALEAEWPPYTDPDPDSGWCVHERYVKYIIIYGT